MRDTAFAKRQEIEARIYLAGTKPLRAVMDMLSGVDEDTIHAHIPHRFTLPQQKNGAAL